MMQSAPDMSCACTFQDTPYLYQTCGATLTLFMGLLETVLRARCDIADPCRRLGRSDMNLDGEHFDFIVVGAGVSGPVVAGRLAENPNWSVLLLEAGPEEPTATQVPAFATSAVGTMLDWNYTTVVQENACLNKGGVCNWPRGKMVGGTNAMNGMMYTRGHRSIYDQFAAEGIKGWGYDDVLPFFKKAEHNSNPEEVDKGYHGSNGPMNIEMYPWSPEMTKDIIAAGNELGYRQGDLNGANQTGINRAQMMQKDGLRMTTSRAYLRPKKHQQNIKVATESHVTRVLIDDKHKRAIGVEFVDRNGNYNVVIARKEVILSAGTVGSPQLLLLSGVGPKEELEALGITVKVDLPGVGKNLRNHVSAGVGCFIDEPSTRTLTMETENEFLVNRTGPMASTGLTQTTAFLLSKQAKDGVPDLQVFFDGYGASCSRTGLATECTTGDVPDCNGKCSQRYINVRPTNVRPKSVGSLKLRSADPFDYPLIDPQYLSQEEDVQVLVEGIKLLLNFTKTKPMSKYGFRLNTSPVSGCEKIEFGTDEYWACAVRRNTGPENHQVGTCSMGRPDDPMAVLDPQLRVRGIEGLRVVDASIFPQVPNCNTVGPIMMAGEKAADLIKAQWTKLDSHVNNKRPRPDMTIWGIIQRSG